MVSPVSTGEGERKMFWVIQVGEPGIFNGNASLCRFFLVRGVGKPAVPQYKTRTHMVGNVIINCHIIIDAVL